LVNGVAALLAAGRERSLQRVIYEASPTTMNFFFAVGMADDDQRRNV
jgi:hypothetical protein